VEAEDDLKMSNDNEERVKSKEKIWLRAICGGVLAWLIVANKPPEPPKDFRAAL
jgi:hypothetical protein